MVKLPRKLLYSAADPSSSFTGYSVSVMVSPFSFAVTVLPATASASTVSTEPPSSFCADDGLMDLMIVCL